MLDFMPSLDKIDLICNSKVESIFSETFDMRILLEVSEKVVHILYCI